MFVMESELFVALKTLITQLQTQYLPSNMTQMFVEFSCLWHWKLWYHYSKHLLLSLKQHYTYIQISHRFQRAMHVCCEIRSRLWHRKLGWHCSKHLLLSLQHYTHIQISNRFQEGNELSHHRLSSTHSPKAISKYSYKGYLFFNIYKKQVNIDVYKLYQMP